MIVQLIDAITNYVYQVEVTETEAIRVQDDLAFAQQLLEDAKVRGDERNPEYHDENSTQTHDKEIKHVWSYKDTVFLIDSVSSHYEEIKHTNPKIKKKGWENILNDLLSATIAITILELKKKWSNLVQSHNKAKDIHKKSGGTPSRFNFFEKIDDILGDKASNGSPHSFDSGNISESSIKFSETAAQETQSVLKDNKLVETDKSISSPSVQARKRNSPAAQYLLMKKQYLNSKEEDLLERRQERQRKENIKNENLKLLKERNVIEARKAKALEDLVAFKKNSQ